jgi:branched-chain amino acid transport system permease protein
LHRLLSPNLRWLRWTVGALLLALFPVFVREPYYITLAVNLAITLILTLSLNFVVGTSGQWSFAHAAFFGMGAYVPGVLASRFGLDGWLGLPLSVASTSVLATVVGLPIVRLRGYYLAVCTLALGFLAEIIVRQAVDLTGGGYGIQQIPPLFIAGYRLQGGSYYLLAVAALLASSLLLDNIKGSTLGHAIVASRDNPIAAASCGINVGRVKLTAFVITAGLAALAGWVHTFYYLALNPSLLASDLTFLWYFMVFIGGLGSVPGVVIGTALLSIAPEFLGMATHNRVLAFGLLMLGVALFAPRGIGGALTGLLQTGRLLAAERSAK